MPAVSQQQQKLFGLALSVKRGETPRSEASQDVLDIVDKMSEKDIEDFAGTEHKGLPTKVETKLRSIVREILREKAIQEAETFTATNKKSGKTSVFKSKDARDAAIKSGTHTAKKDNKGSGNEPKNDTPKVNIFNKPSADNNKSSVDDTKQATQSIVSALGPAYDSKNIEYWAKRTGVDLSQVSKAIESGELDIRDLKTYISIPELPDAQKMVAKYGGPEYVEEPVAKRQSKFKSSKPVKIDDIEDYSDIEDVIDTYKDKLPDNEKKALEILHAAWQDAEAKMMRSGNDDKYEERVSKILTKIEKVLSNAGILSK